MPSHHKPQLTLFAECAVHACDTPVASKNDVCPGCLDLFGPMLRLRTASSRQTTQQEPTTATAPQEADTKSSAATADAGGERTTKPVLVVRGTSDLHKGASPLGVPRVHPRIARPPVRCGR